MHTDRTIHGFEGDTALQAARAGNAAAFNDLLGPHLAELRRHSYRILGSQDDAEDAVQEVLLKAWQALPRFDGRSSLRTWLFRITTNVSLNMIERNPKRVLRLDGTPPSDPRRDPRNATKASAWLGPLLDDLVDGDSEQPEVRYLGSESVELAFVAALQHLTARQRAVLVLREVIGFTGAETATILDTNPDSVYSLLQRAHQALEGRLLPISQRQTARLLGDRRIQAIVDGYKSAWEAADVDALAAMLAEDATMTMPPRPTWYAGRGAIATFLSRGPMDRTLRWRLTPTRANGQLAFACYRGIPREGRFGLHALHVLNLDTGGSIAQITAFLHPLSDRGLPAVLVEDHFGGTADCSL